MAQAWSVAELLRVLVEDIGCANPAARAAGSARLTSAGEVHSLRLPLLCTERRADMRIESLPASPQHG